MPGADRGGRHRGRRGGSAVDKDNTNGSGEDSGFGQGSSQNRMAQGPDGNGAGASDGREDSYPAAARTSEDGSYEAQMENRIRNILKSVDGVGKVDVMVVLKSSSEKVLRVDRSTNTSTTQEKDSGGGTRDVTNNQIQENTILAGSGSGSSTNAPIVEKELSPEISGIIISAEGGGSPTVKAEISEAMEALFGLPAHKIKSIKEGGINKGVQDMKIKNMKQVKKHMKDMNMKRLFRRNQIIITTLAVMIAAAGYLNYAGRRIWQAATGCMRQAPWTFRMKISWRRTRRPPLNGQAGLQEIPSLDQDPSDLDAVSDADGAQAAADTGADQGQLAQAGDGTGVEEATQAADPGQMAAADTDSSAQAGLENPGEAVLTSGMNVADYIANVQLSREQVRAKNKETLMSLINSDSIDEAAKQQAIQDMIDLTEVSEKENAAETLLMAKGFSDPVVSITKDKVDVVINAPSITDPQRAQIEDIVKRKAEVGADQIIITLLNMAE